MGVIEQIKEYIVMHLQEPISAKDIAAAAGYSQYHAMRLFRSQTGETPFEFIRRQRMIASAHQLRHDKQRVVDVAFDYVFDSHEGFTRAFSHTFGITPKSYASYTKSEGWLIPYRYLDHQMSKTKEKMMGTEGKVIFTQIVERPARKLILRRSKNATEYFEYCEELGCGSSNNSQPWDYLVTIKEALYEPVGLWLPENMRNEGTGIYAHGVEVPQDYNEEIPSDYDIIELEACKLLVFQGEPYSDSDFEDKVLDCMEQIEKFNPEVYGYTYLPERAPRMQLEPWGWRGYIEMRCITEIENKR